MLVETDNSTDWEEVPGGGDVNATAAAMVLRSIDSSGFYGFSPSHRFSGPGGLVEGLSLWLVSRSVAMETPRRAQVKLFYRYINRTMFNSPSAGYLPVHSMRQLITDRDPKTGEQVVVKRDEDEQPAEFSVLVPEFAYRFEVVVPLPHLSQSRDQKIVHPGQLARMWMGKVNDNVVPGTEYGPDVVMCRSVGYAPLDVRIDSLPKLYIFEFEFVFNPHGWNNSIIAEYRESASGRASVRAGVLAGDSPAIAEAKLPRPMDTLDFQDWGIDGAK